MNIKTILYQASKTLSNFSVASAQLESEVLLSEVMQLSIGVLPGILLKYQPYSPFASGIGDGFERTSSRERNR